MHVPERRRQPIDTRIRKLPRLVRRRQHPLQIRRVADAILAPLDPARLRLRRDTPVVAIRRELPRLGQILVLGEMAHVHHDAVEHGHVGGAPDRRRVLRVVQMQRYGYGGGARGEGYQRREVGGVVERPGEEEQHGGGAEAFGSTDRGEGAFDVVLEGLVRIRW